MSLDVLWFVILAIFWIGFFVLEGFDFGVGMLHRFMGRNDTEQRVVINTIGPWWDGNEVWLIVAGAATFAAFSDWYATWFSAGYLALFLVIVGLTIRGVAFEWRAKGHSQRWRDWFSWMLVVGSAMVPLLLGVALGDLLVGLPVDATQEFTGSFWDLLTPYGLWVGLTLLVLCLLHGATFLGLRTGEPLLARARGVAQWLAWPSLVLVLVFGWWTFQLGGGGAWRLLAAAIPVVAALGSAVLLRGHREGWSFSATGLAIGATMAALFANLFPNVLVSSTSAAYTLTVEGSAANEYALQVMTVVAVLLFPVVLVYQGLVFPGLPGAHSRSGARRRRGGHTRRSLTSRRW